MYLCVHVRCVVPGWVLRPTDGPGGSRSVRSGSEPALRLVGCTCEAPPTGIGADLTQRFCGVVERRHNIIRSVML